MYIFAGRFKGRRLFFPPSSAKPDFRHRQGFGGYVGGRSPKEKTLRPTTGLVRRALFDILAPIISDRSFLDLYAGTGAVGLEAVSRGAGKVLLVESNPKTALCLKQNLELIMAAAKKEGDEIAEENLKFYPYSAEKAITVLAEKKEGFDIIFADPPYSFIEQKITELIAQIIGTPPLAPKAHSPLARAGGAQTYDSPPLEGGARGGGILNPDGTLVLQHLSGLEKKPFFQEGLAALSLAVETRRYGYTSLSFLYPPSGP